MCGFFLAAGKVQRERYFKRGTSGPNHTSTSLKSGYPLYTNSSDTLRSIIQVTTQRKTTAANGDNYGRRTASPTAMRSQMRPPYLDIAKQLVVVGGDDHVHRLDGASERLVHLLRGEVELQQSAVNLYSVQ